MWGVFFSVSVEIGPFAACDVKWDQQCFFNKKCRKKSFFFTLPLRIEWHRTEKRFQSFESNQTINDIYTWKIYRLWVRRNQFQCDFYQFSIEFVKSTYARTHADGVNLEAEGFGLVFVCVCVCSAIVFRYLIESSFEWSSHQTIRIHNGWVEKCWW